MKRLYPLLFISVLIYWGCEDPKEENKPTPVTLSLDSSDVLKWDMNEDTDFFRYSLYGSNNSSMENKTLIYETQTRLDTTYTLDSSEYYYLYQVDIMNLNEYVSSSNILNGFVELWGVVYSVEDTDTLDLRDNHLTGEIPPEIGNLTNLSELYLVDNQLTGSIPSEIGNLTNLTRLYLSYNELTGSIPSEIWNLTNLTRLYLGYNQLTGSIPSEIGNLTNLEILYLDYDLLTGEIPESICDLNINWSSGDFNITNNQLCPPYPSCIEDYVGEQDTSNCEQVSIIDETLPITYNLYNAYPNPFNPVTTLQYDLPENANVNITIYDIMGRIVKTMVNTQQNAGYKSIQWNATNNLGQPVSAGLYLYTIQAGKFRQTKKMVLLK